MQKLVMQSKTCSGRARVLCRYRRELGARSLAASTSRISSIAPIDSGLCWTACGCWTMIRSAPCSTERRVWAPASISTVFRNPGDWSTEELFEYLGAFEASDKRFALFLEGLASADVVPDEPAQRSFVNAVNHHLRAVGIELRETGTDGGYPVFSVASTRSKKNGRPKNLIFASPTKPDIRFRDAINNDIEIVENADSVLVYDRPIGADGIRWRDLQTWWKETRNLQNDDEAKSTLYKRLRQSLPANSPPQLLLYDLYHEIFSTSVQDLPALLPEVWLHWDPKTVQMRGTDALLRFRMDFLLLLPRGQRVVLEVDGMRHYANNGRPDPSAYASNMRADRDLKLSGYEVFRFGAAELQDRQQTREMVQRFFEDLFRWFDVITA
jgi:very-short-patch-repair endonuclease